MSLNPMLSDAWHVVADRRLRLRPDLHLHRQQWRGRTWMVIGDPYTQRFYRIDLRAWGWLQLLDGRHTVADAWAQALQGKGTALGQEEALRLIGQFLENGLIISDRPGERTPALTHFIRQRRREIGAGLMQFLFVRIPLWDPDRLLQWLLPVARVFLNRVGALAWLALVVGALLVVAGQSDRLWTQGAGVLAPENLPWLYLAWVWVKLCHELGHGLLCRLHGGAVHTFGVMLLVFTPLPYVDASAAWGFRQRGQRLMVGAGGMVFELGVAAVAALVWAATHDALIQQLCFNIMLIASVSTLLFNANPLLKFDGYYLLSDWLDLPNLYQRSRQQIRYLWERYAIGLPQVSAPAASMTEGAMLAGYAIASAAYRLVLLVSILWLLMTRLPGIGLVLALAAAVIWFVLPVARGLHGLFFGDRYAVVRARALGVSGGALTLLFVALFVLPLPRSTIAAGRVVAVQHAPVFLAADGWFDQWQVPHGHQVAANEPLAQLSNPQLELQLANRTAEHLLTRLRLQDSLAQQPELQRPLQLQLQAVQADQQRIAQQLDALLPRAPFAGVVHRLPDAAWQGRFVRRGTAIASVIDLSEFEFVTIIAQEQATLLLRAASPDVAIRLYALPRQPLSARIRQLSPLAMPDVHSASGASANPALRVVLQLEPHTSLPLIDGLQGKAVFRHPAQPAGIQLIRWTQQLVLQR